MKLIKGKTYTFTATGISLVDLLQGNNTRHIFRYQSIYSGKVKGGLYCFMNSNGGKGSVTVACYTLKQLRELNVI